VISKETTRRLLLQDVAGGGFVVETTDDGALDGTTFVTSLLVGRGIDFLAGWWATRTAEGATEYRQVWQMNKGTGEFSCLDSEGNGAGFSSQVEAGETIELSPWRPDMFTRAMNRAISVTRRWLFVPFWDGSISLTTGTYEYELPEGITPDMITKVAMEGYGSFEGMPYYEWGDVSYRPADPAEEGSVTAIILNRTRPSYRDVVTGKKLYLIGGKYLTQFALDTPTFTLVDDQVDVLELDETTDAFELFIAFAKWLLMDLVAYQPITQSLVDWAGQTARAKAEAYSMVSRLGMPKPESYFSFG